jgi:hypothetical protein
MLRDLGFVYGRLCTPSSSRSLLSCHQLLLWQLQESLDIPQFPLQAALEYQHQVAHGRFLAPPSKTIQRIQIICPEP